jgi:hypothetical protein
MVSVERPSRDTIPLRENHPFSYFTPTAGTSFPIGQGKETRIQLDHFKKLGD